MGDTKIKVTGSEQFAMRPSAIGLYTTGYRGGKAGSSGIKQRLSTKEFFAQPLKHGLLNGAIE